MRFTFQNFTLYRSFENFGQTLHLRFDQRITRTHAIADEQVFDQVGRKIHHHSPSDCRTNGSEQIPALHIAGVGVDQMRATQLAIGIINFPGSTHPEFQPAAHPYGQA